MTKKYFPALLQFAFPFLAWAYAFKEFFLKKATIDLDTFTIYAISKYFFVNLRHGFPDWNPYSLWGMGHLRQMGEFNPLFYIIPLFDLLGLDFYQSFICMMILCFFAGALGFYLLAKIILNDKNASYLAFLLFLFSSLGLLMFIQVTYVLIFVPAIWFFYFLLIFFRDYKRSQFVFLTFSLMVIMATYIPFYFITTLLVLMPFFIIFYFNDFKRCLAGLLNFARKNFLLFGLGVLAVAIAVFPSFLTWVSLNEHFKPLARPTTVTYPVVKSGGIPVTEILRDFSAFNILLQSFRMKIFMFSREFFSLRNMPFGNHRLFYIPIFAHIIIAVSLLTRASKKLFVLCLLTCALFLISIVDLSPLYEFLFNHIFYFRLFRNVFLLSAVLMMFYILMACEQFRLLLDQIPAHPRGRWFACGWTFLVCSAAFLFLRAQPNVLISTYVTLGASFLFFVLVFWGILKAGELIFTVSVLILSFVQPMEVSGNFLRHAIARKPGIVAESIRQDKSRMDFSYHRPSLEESVYKDMGEEDIYRRFFADLVEMKDSPGLFSSNCGYPPEWTLRLWRSVPYAFLEPYITHKFVLYDKVFLAEDSEADLTLLVRDLKNLENLAYVAWDGRGGEIGDLPDSLQNNRPGLSERAQIISEDNEYFKVVHFSANEIRMTSDFKVDKFLVYNDSFHPQWKAFLNGRQVRLYRSNFAFKGIVVPAGNNSICFRYEPKGGRMISPAIFLFFAAFLGIGMFFVLQERRETNSL
ncbi:MAG: hypothetical protein WC552_02460 [Candidatus Omnitrophota bacterium]